MVCRHCFVVDLVEEIVGEGGSRSSSRVHEHDSFQLVSQQSVAIQAFWSPCQPRSTLSARDLHHGKQQVSPFYRDLFRLPHWSSCCHEKNVFGALLLEGKTTGFSLLSWSGFGFGWLDWELFACRPTSPSGCRATSEPKFFIHSCFKEIFGGGRGDAKTFSYMTSPVSIRTTFGIQ